MTNKITCARVGCNESATYDRPLCYKHWKEFDSFRILECERCHRFDEVIFDDGLCMDCTRDQEVIIHAHGSVDYVRRYLYILKLDGGEFYVGYTKDLEERLKEHQDGRTRSTKGKHPKLVWFEKRVGDFEELKEEEDDLTYVAKNNPRVIRRMISEWQRPLLLVDFES